MGSKTRTDHRRKLAILHPPNLSSRTQRRTGRPPSPRTGVVFYLGPVTTTGPLRGTPPVHLVPGGSGSPQVWSFDVGPATGYTDDDVYRGGQVPDQELSTERPRLFLGKYKRPSVPRTTCRVKKQQSSQFICDLLFIHRAILFVD